MTSISQQPIIPPQVPGSTNATQVASVHPAPPSISGTTSPLAAVPAPATARSYANATKKPFSPPIASSTTGPSSPVAVGGSTAAQHGKSSSISPVNGKHSIPPAVPVAPSIVNSNNVVNGSSSSGTHARKPSVTISAAGTSGYIPNGGPVAGPASRPGSIQFGSINAGGSPAAANPVPQSHQSNSSLAVSAPTNPRITSPQTSPSPIPQPAASGGRPPSGLQGQGNGLSFGSLGGEAGDSNRQMRQGSTPQGPLAPTPQSSHLRRESSQSNHSDMSNPGMGPGPGPGRGGYPPQGGRGRGFQPYPQQMPYSPGPNFRGTPNQPRGANIGPQFQSQGAPMGPYPNSPHRAARSPALTSSHPATPQMQQMPMASPQIQSGHYGGYPSHMGPPQVKPLSFSYIEPIYVSQAPGQTRRQNLFLKQDSLQPLPPPDLSPENPFFEYYLMMRNQNQYGMPQFDQGYGYPQTQYPMYPQMHYMGAPPSSPRPPYHVPQGNQQSYIPGQYSNHQQATPMSRPPSAISVSERPSSSLGQPQTPAMTPATSHTQHSSHTTNTPVSAPAFTRPTKKSAIVIKDPLSGAVKTFDKPPASPATVSRSPVVVSSTPTPPPRTASHTENQHARIDSKSNKSDEEKKNDMRDAIAKKIEADKAEEKRKREEEEQQAARLKEEAAQAKELAEKAQREAEEKEQQAKEEAEKAKKEADEKAKKEAEEKEQLAKEEAEQAKKEAEEKARLEEEEEEIRLAEEAARLEEEEEERFQQKKRKEKEEQAKREAEAAAKEEENIKIAEREAEEAEEVRLKKLAEEEGDESKAERENLFAALKNNDAPAESSASTTASPKAPQETEAVSNDSMGPPATARSVSGGKRDKPAALKLETAKANTVEPPQPSAAMQSLKSARFIQSLAEIAYPAAIASPNPSLNVSVQNRKFKYEKDFLLQFQVVFTEKPSIDWDNKVKETVGDTSDSARSASARTPSVMGARQNSNRPPLSSAFSMGGAMGVFQQPPKTDARGTTSAERYAASNMANQRPSMSNPLAGLVGRPGGFPSGGPTPMSRNNSSTTLQSQSGAPQSPRTGNRSQRGGGGSRRGNHGQSNAREDAQAAQKMPLTVGADLTPLQVSQTGWKPRSIGSSNATGAAGPAPGGDGSAHMAPDMVQRKVKSHLNKMTPEKFDKLADQILDIVAQSKNESDGRTLRQVIQLTFEKATDEAHWASMYAKFCKRMLETMSPDIKDENIRDKNDQIVTGGNLFRKYLLNRCQEEFERGWKLNLPDKPEGESEEAVMLSDEYYIAAAAKRRGLGLVQFIGELYKLGMLTERIMHECVKKLVDYEGVPDEAEVESLTKLLKTIGRNLDSTEKGKPLMDIYFQRITAMMDTPGLNSRLKFMLLDIVDLRRKGWVSKEADKGPKTLDQIKAEALEAQQAKDMERQRQNQRGGGGGANRLPMGRGDARSFSGGGQYGMMPPPDYHKNTVGMDDLRKLGKGAGSRQVSQGPATFGPTSMFNSRSSSGRKPPGPGGIARGGEESGASSRTATPPAQKEKEPSTSANAFSALAGLGDASEEPANPASPPSTHSSPPTTKSKPAEERPKSPLKAKDGEVVGS
ncbi:MAG: hypothetical protein M1827_005860 [Pycnora praestabilis]|nr:MAG: hypothetical protein M1827_005860 [Pycnora praestabilis]